MSVRKPAWEITDDERDRAWANDWRKDHTPLEYILAVEDRTAYIEDTIYLEHYRYYSGLQAAKRYQTRGGRP